MSHQSAHLGKLGSWSSGQCASTGGFEGLLSPLTSFVPQVSNRFSPKIAQCQRGMTGVSDKIKRTADDYASAEKTSTDAINRIYPDAISHFPDIGALGLPDIGNFTDEPVSLEEPQSAEEDTEENIKHQLLTLRNGFWSGPLATAEKVFKFCTGQSLVELLLDPLVGQYGRLKYLHDSYEELSQGLYTVAATTRKGSWKLGEEWTGQAATNFDSYMFRWSMGIGGLGDAAKLVGNAYRDAYYVIIGLVHEALREINRLINNELEELVKQGAELAAGDAGIEAAGLGPEDPLADIGAGIYTAYKLYKIYKIVARVITAINVIIGIYHAISKAVSDISTAVNAIVEAFSEPLPSVGELVNDVEQRGFGFEQGDGWNATAGAARIALLPPA